MAPAPTKVVVTLGVMTGLFGVGVEVTVISTDAVDVRV